MDHPYNFTFCPHPQRVRDGGCCGACPAIRRDKGRMYVIGTVLAGVILELNFHYEMSQGLVMTLLFLILMIMAEKDLYLGLFMESAGESAVRSNHASEEDGDIRRSVRSWHLRGESGRMRESMRMTMRSHEYFDPARTG